MWRSRDLRGRLLRGALWVLVLGAAAVALRLTVFRPAPRPGRAVEVRRQEFVQTVEMAGELQAVRAATLGPVQVRDVWEYKISYLEKESAPVRKGQPVLRFDADALKKALDEKTAEHEAAVTQIERRRVDLQMQITQQEVTLAEARAQLRKAELLAEVPADLQSRNEARKARIDLEDARGLVRSQEAQLEAIRKIGALDLRTLEGRRDRAAGRVAELREAIAAMTVRAPQDGIVILRAHEGREKPKAGDSVWAADKVVEIPDLSEMKALAEVDEADAGRLAVGQKVRLRLDARPDVDYKGAIRSIGQSVRRKSWRTPVKIIAVEASLDRSDPEVMRPNMRFRGEIETGVIPGVLAIPADAVFLRAGGPVAWVKRGRDFEETPVRIGRTNRRLVEILEGLSEGDIVWTADLAPAERPSGPVPLAARRGP